MSAKQEIINNHESKKSDSTHTLYKLLLGVVAVFFLIVRINFLDIPLDRDEGSLLYSGYCLLNGKIPYVDFYEIKPPGIFVVYGIFHLLFGHSNVLLHIGLLLLQISIAFLIFKFAFRLFENKKIGYVSAAFFLIFSLNPFLQAFAIMSEYFLILFILLAFLPLLHNSGRVKNKNFLLSGLFLGIAAMIRQHAIFFLIPYFILVLQAVHYKPWALFNAFKYLIAGSLLFIVPVIGYVAARGAWDDMLYWTWQRPNASFMQEISFEMGQTHLFNFLKMVTDLYYPFFILAVGGLIFLIPDLKKLLHSKSLFLMLLFIMSLWSVFPGNRFYGHYWITTLPAVCIVIAASLLFAEGSGNKEYKLLTFGIVLSAVSIHLISNKNLYIISNPDQIYRKIYGENPNYAIRPLIKHLNKHLKQDDELFVFGSEPQVYYESRKIPAIRHSYIGTVHVPGPTNEPYQNEVLQYLDSKRPEFLLHVQYAYSVFMTPESSRKLYNRIFSIEDSQYRKIAIGEETGDGRIIYLYGAEAVNYEPKSDKYIILYVRKDRTL